ncbi:MAG: hypothetical protein LIQ31_14630 [Planctomycetes bacterium]|nr:hypothetical protein [Planctomycetota bacterium]
MTAATRPSDTVHPPLRAEIELLPGPPGADGSPTGILHDPVAGTYDAFGWAEGEVLTRLRRRVSLGELHSRLARETTVPVDRDAIAAFVKPSTPGAWSRAPVRRSGAGPGACSPGSCPIPFSSGCPCSAPTRFSTKPCGCRASSDRGP